VAPAVTPVGAHDGLKARRWAARQGIKPLTRRARSAETGNRIYERTAGPHAGSVTLRSRRMSAFGR